MNSNSVLLLQELASVTTMLAFRDKAAKYDDMGNAYGISIKDLVSSWPQPLELFARIRARPEIFQDRLREGDVLMPARGNFYPARYFSDNQVEVFPLGQIYVIRPYEWQLGRFLAWYLNRQQIQNKIRSAVSGSTVLSLKRSTLNALTIHLPSAEIRERVSTLTALSDNRTLLRAKLAVAEKAELEAACELLFKKDNDAGVL
jgi:hypothetical protein